jgi:hypothetical protein
MEECGAEPAFGSGAFLTVPIAFSLFPEVGEGFLLPRKRAGGKKEAEPFPGTGNIGDQPIDHARNTENEWLVNESSCFVCEYPGSCQPAGLDDHDRVGAHFYLGGRLMCHNIQSSTSWGIFGKFWGVLENVLVLCKCNWKLAWKGKLKSGIEKFSG